MEYPQRAENHIIETDSWKILRDHAPMEWILREVSERDYGIDCYIEIADCNSRITGKLLSGQVKGTGFLDWPKKGEVGKRVTTYSGIERATVNYWMGLSVPVFLFVADLHTRNVYFAPVKHQVRERYTEYLGQKTFGFEMGEFTELCSERGRSIFNTYFYLENSFLRYETAILTLISHWKAYFRFIDEHESRDDPEGIETNVEVQFLQIYQTCEFLAGFFGIAWNFNQLSELYRKDKEVFNDEWYRLHQWTFNRYLPSLRDSLTLLILKVKERLTKTQRSYWSHVHPIIQEACERLQIDHWQDEYY